MAAYRAAAATLAAAAIAFAAAPSAIGAGSGLAWDSVTKLSMNTDASTLSPGDFNADYTRAAAVSPPPDSSKGGLAGKFGEALALGRHMQALMQNGFAEKHYIAGSKERTDQVGDQTATIVDCAARTVTTLDLRHKTYKVQSLDAPSAPNASDSSSAPQPRATDDIKHLSIVIANKALGPKTVAGEPTQAFQSDLSFTEIRSDGQTQSQNGDIVGYFSSYSNPFPTCSWSGNRPEAHGKNVGANFSAMTAGYARLMRALAVGSGDSRFSIKQSGPPLPHGKLALFEAATLGGGPSGGGTFMTERGNVRTIAANDPIFSVPNDFTPEK